MIDSQITQIRAQVHKATIAAAYSKMVYTVLRITNRQEQYSKTEGYRQLQTNLKKNLTMQIKSI